MLLPINFRNRAVTPSEKVLLTLRYYATGSFVHVAGDFVGVHKSTAGKIIVQVSEALAARRAQFIAMPSTNEEVRKVRQEFYNIAKFPRCIGSIDCTHIKIASVGGDQAEIYRNRKNFFSLNVQTISDPQLRICNIVARWPGSAHDSTILNNSVIKQRFENGEFGDSVLVGDSGYAIHKFLITPLLNPTTEPEQVFNESIIRTRNTVERSYGAWKRRFPILSRGIGTKVSTAMTIIVACAVLHNIAREFGDQLPRVSKKLEREIQLTQVNNPINAVEGANRSVHRTPFLTYFSGVLQEHYASL